MKPNVFHLLTLRLGQLLRVKQQHSASSPAVILEHERERPLSDYEMYYWGFSPAPWY